MIGGVDKPSSGKIIINGTNIYELSEPKQAEFRRKEVALIYQFYNLIPVLDVEENMCLPVKLRRRQSRPKRVRRINRKTGLKGKTKKLIQRIVRRATTKSCDRKKFTSKAYHITCR